MAFAQLIEYTTSKPDEVQQIHEEWEQKSQGTRKARRVLLMKHRDDPNRFCELVFFDSYDSAMENSELPETQEYARRFRDALDGEASYINFDILEDRTL